jgi:NAD(P)-dependent dehydrogenase (short-subunit alcohol dehydrogenase family)
MVFWQGKAVLVTGAGSGIGKALAGALAERGAAVWLADIDASAAAAAAQGVGGTAVVLDVRDAAAFQAAVARVAARHGRIDALFNNAGIGIGGALHELAAAHFDRCIDVNIRGVVHGIVAAYPLMVAQKGGIIANTASAAGLVGMPLLAPYSMTKHAVVGLTAALRHEAAPHGIRVCALCPGTIETPMLDAPMPAGLAPVWRPDFRRYLTRVGGAPYPAAAFAAHALRRIERNAGIAIAPAASRLRLALGRIAPRLVESLVRKAYREAVAARPRG